MWLCSGDYSFRFFSEQIREDKEEKSSKPTKVSSYNNLPDII
jgi:hypothetical protein